RLCQHTNVFGGTFLCQRSRAARDLMSRRFKARRDRIERSGVRYFPAEKTDALLTGALEDDTLFAVLHAERDSLAALVDALKTEHAAGIFRPVFHIVGANP